MFIGISIVPDDMLILRGGFQFWIPYESRGFLAGSDLPVRTTYIGQPRQCLTVRSVG